MQNRKQLQRIPEQGKIAGVCAGVAEYTGTETWLVRVIWFSGLLLSGGFFFIAYVAGWFIMDKKPSSAKQRSQSSFQTGGFNKTKDQWFRTSDDEDIDRSVEVKTKVWQAGEPPRVAFRDIARQFDSIERRVRNVEGYVTSNEFTLKREISRL